MTNTKQETPSKDDLAGFKRSAPQHRLDDKAAVLEKEVQSLKSGFNRERFLYFFVIECLILVLIEPSIESGRVFGLLVVAALLFSIGLGKHLDFPWIGVYLEKWHDLFYETAERALRKKPGKLLETEPLDNGKD